MMIVSSLSYLLLGNVSLYEKQVPTRVDSPAHIGDFAVDVMERLRVRDAVLQGRQVQTIRENMPFEQILQLMLGESQQDFPVVDNEENLTGIISMTDLRQAMADKELHRLLLAKDIAMGGVTTVTMDDTLNEALRLMAVIDVRELPVVNGDNQRKVISIVSRKDITRAYHKEMEHTRRPSPDGSS
jgi:CIC family chloride channel protein